MTSSTWSDPRSGFESHRKRLIEKNSGSSVWNRDYADKNSNCFSTNNCLSPVRFPFNKDNSWKTGQPNLYDGNYTAYFSDVEIAALKDPTKANELNLKGTVQLGATWCSSCQLQVMLFVWSRNNPENKFFWIDLLDVTLTGEKESKSIDIEVPLPADNCFNDEI